MLTQAQVKELLRYDPKTGLFKWRIDQHRSLKAGTIAGGPTFQGRTAIGINGRIYFASRLAVLWMTGAWPAFTVDHRNGDPSDDRWSNLRIATLSQNHQNRRVSNKRKLPKGVSWEKQTCRYKASICVNYRRITLGRFDIPEEAHAAYMAAAKKYFGEFARAK